MPIGVLVLFPFGVWIRAWLMRNTSDDKVEFEPPASIIVACYNEEAYIDEKVESILAKENWIEGSELIVVSGGSTDGTNDILNHFKERKEVKLILLEDRTAKIDAVNLAVSQAKCDFLVFSDCRQKMKIGSIKQLLRNFSDEEVGTVSSSLHDTRQGGKASFFRRMFNIIACKSSEYSSCLNVYGALYAQRKSVYRKIPSDLLFDDLFVVVSTLNQGKRLIQEEKSVIYDVNFSDYYGKERIRRLVRGLLLFLVKYRGMIFSLPKRTLLQFLTYKYLKILLPYLLVIGIVSGSLLSIFLMDLKFMLILISLIICFIIFFRKFLVLLARINYHVFMASLAFVFGRQRSNKWEKLSITNLK